MIEKIKEHKKDILTFLVILIISFIMCSAFLRPHYPHDTYKIIRDGLTYYSYERFLQDGRPFTAILTVLADMVNMPIEVYMILSLILALIFLSCSVIIIYKMFKNKLTENSKILNIMIILISFIIIYNYLSIEYIYYLESFMLALGILLSVLAFKVIVNKEKYAYTKSCIIMIIAAFCYQGSIAIFPMLAVTYFLLFEKDYLKENIVNIIKVALIYGFSMLLTIIYSNVLFAATRIRVSFLDFDFADLLNRIKILVIDSLDVIPSYVHIGIILFTVICICFAKKDKIKLLLSYLFIMIASIGICITPTIIGSGLDMEPRICMAFGTTIGISLLFILYMVQKSNKYLKTLAYVFISIVFVLNFAVYLIITYQHIMVNKLDEKNCEIINEVITEYEKENNIEVNKIAVVLREGGREYYPGFIEVGDMTQSALTSWAAREAIIFYTGRKMSFEKVTYEQFMKYFAGKEWDGFSKDQIAIDGDVLLFCGN